ncbi:MAG: hypothetical protein IPG68_14890, partial [Micrococcales bacterium]|nr:hypothetical protein [Micrococcales bacterium]
RFGITNNPRADGRTVRAPAAAPAAAVAARIVPLAVGGDAGELDPYPRPRVPGLFGLKPRRGRVSRGLTGKSGARCCTGVLTRTAVDSAWVYDILAGALPSDRWQATPLSSSLTQATSTDPPPLRIGWTTDRPDHGRGVNPQVVAAVSAVADRLRDLGHQVPRFTRTGPASAARCTCSSCVGSARLPSSWTTQSGWRR